MRVVFKQVAIFRFALLQARGVRIRCFDARAQVQRRKLGARFAQHAHCRIHRHTCTIAPQYAVCNVLRRTVRPRRVHYARLVRLRQKIGERLSKHRVARIIKYSQKFRVDMTNHAAFVEQQKRVRSIQHGINPFGVPTPRAIRLCIKSLFRIFLGHACSLNCLRFAKSPYAARARFYSVAAPLSLSRACTSSV